MPRILSIAGRSPSIDPGAYVADDVTIAGSVTLAAGVSVWFGCVLRSEKTSIEVGEDTNLQDYTVVHTDASNPTVIGRRVTVGHRVILHGCRVDDDVLVGMGAIVMNRAHIGEGAVVAAGAVVTEDMVVPPRTIAVGIPAKIIERPVPPVPRKNVANYLEFAEMFRNAIPVDGSPS